MSEGTLVAAGVSYHGLEYCGWQRQQHSPSVQACVEEALSCVANQPIVVQCAGRTDSGVHAMGQVIHFYSTAERSNKAWQLGANGLLPKSIALTWVKQMPLGSDFHARFKAISRCYRYELYQSPHHLPLYEGRMTWQRRALDLDAMQQAIPYFLGEQDFSALRSSECQAKTPWRCIEALTLEAHGQRVIITCRANAFLHHMVRNIVGNLLWVGQHRQPISWVKDVLESGDRRQGAPTAPACGLCLQQVVYPKEYDLPMLNDSKSLEG